MTWENKSTGPMIEDHPLGKKKLEELRKRRVAVPLATALSIDWPSDKPLFDKVIKKKTIGMMAGPRGGGKTLLAMMLGYAFSAEKELLPWGYGKGGSVCYLDGEMRAGEMVRRIKMLHGRNKCAQSIEKVESNFYLLSRDMFADSIGVIDTEEGQANIDAMIPPSTDLLIIDNLSAWTSGGQESASSWAVTKTWLIRKRLSGQAVLLVHHTGKNGQQRGTSAHEDLLDYSILLSPTVGKQALDETNFSVEHTKLRDYCPELRQKFEFSIYPQNDVLMFDVVEAGLDISTRAAEILRLHEEGKSGAEISVELEINKSTVSRTLKKYRKQNFQ